MWIIPITYKLKYEHEKFNENELLDLIEAYLKELNFGIINRKENYIFFHKGSFFHSLNFRDLLGSGSIKLKQRNDKIIITLKHYFVFLILLFFTVIFLLMTSRYSTFDDGDKQIITIAFIWLFGANYLIKLIAHHGLKRKINEIINQKTN
jgi:hypothetical protein